MQCFFVIMSVHSGKKIGYARLPQMFQVFLTYVFSQYGYDVIAIYFIVRISDKTFGIEYDKRTFAIPMSDVGSGSCDRCKCSIVECFRKEVFLHTVSSQYPRIGGISVLDFRINGKYIFDVFAVERQRPAVCNQATVHRTVYVAYYFR